MINDNEKDKQLKFYTQSEHEYIDKYNKVV